MALETKSGISLKDFRADYLFGLPSSLRKVEDWSELYLHRKIRAAEDEFERTLNCYYTPKRIVSEPENQPGAPLVLGTDYDIAEPAYDYETDFFQGERWGNLRLRKYPIHTIPLPTIRFGYPNAAHTLFTVPADWLRVNGPFGGVRLVPAQSATLMSFNATMLSMLYGGRGIPQTIFVNYTAGFGGVDEKPDLEADHNDFLELTKRLAVLNIIGDAFTATSTSNSADGLTQSFSYPTFKDMRAGFDKDLERFRSKIKGIRMTVV